MENIVFLLENNGKRVKMKKMEHLSDLGELL